MPPEGGALEAGRIARWFGLAILVLETMGRCSGRARRVPIAYPTDGENLLVVPANGGADRTPGWWLNLRAAGDLARHRAGPMSSRPTGIIRVGRGRTQRRAGRAIVGSRPRPRTPRRTRW